jgi:7,8-dihydropterin-6-yl-methyl-4-(beta-D-ribofuranosyl)aminobenzene 5'-phosphate synthase
MKIKVVYDNQGKEGFQSGWGFSALVDDTTLFDTGENAVPLFDNLQAFGVNPAQIGRVILSHEDWDHVGGIALLKQCSGPRVYVPAGISAELKDDIRAMNQEASLFEVVYETTVDADMFTTARLGGRKKEISLVVRLKQGLVVLTGCAHPGLEKILENASQFGNIYAVIGGFHGFDRLEALAGIPVIVPTHCTQKKDELIRRYPDQVQFVGAGSELKL